MQISGDKIDEQVLGVVTQFINQYPQGIIVLYGPTATGKTSLSLRLIEQRFAQTGQHSEIISADSRQIYRQMDIGTDKIPQQYRDRIPHHAIDVRNPDESYSSFDRQKDALQTIAQLHTQNKRPRIVGGTGLYIDSLYHNFSLPHDVQANRQRRAELEQLHATDPYAVWNMLQACDPQTATELHHSNIRYLIRALEIYEQTGIPKSVLVKKSDPQYPLLMLSLTRSLEQSQSLIIQRVGQMLDQGLVTEVQQLLDAGYSPELQSMNGIGYRQTVQALQSTTCYDDAWYQQLQSSISLATYQYAKRQRTWFRRYEKDSLLTPKRTVAYVTIVLD